MKHLRFLLALLLLVSAISCNGGGGKQSVSGTALGASGQDDLLWKGAAPALGDKATMRSAFDVARSVLFDAPSPTGTGATDALPGRRAFVCVYGVEHPNLCGTGAGENLTGSVRLAAESVNEAHGSAIRDARKQGKDVRIKIDVVTRVTNKTFKREVEKPKKRRVALYGYWVENEGNTSYVLPSELLERHIFDEKKKYRGIRRDRLVKALKNRNPDLGALPEELAYDRFYTIPWVEGDPYGVDTPDILRLYRLHRWEFDDLTEELMLQRSVWAADYLISSISSQGKIRYQYYPSTDRDSSSYNLLRHGGTTYSILQAYDRTKYEPYRLASEAAIEYLFAKCKEDVRQGPYGGGPTKWILSPGKKVKLGGAGLALVMLDAYGESTGNYDKFREDARKFGNFLVASLKEDGEFIYFPALTPDGPPTDTDDSAYYPGEAILGLIRLHAWDPNPQWLEAARRASDWLIDVRDAGKDEKRLANDHWLMIALSYLYAETKDDKYLQHSLNLARAVEYQYKKNLKTAKEFKDFQGGYYDPPRSTPAATRGEGLVAVMDTCRVADIECEWVWDLLQETIRHEHLSQYDKDLMWWPRNRAKTFGGWNGGLIDVSIRNDFVQHNMSAVLGNERHLAYRTRQEELPGGPIWTQLNLKGQTYDGVPPEKMKELRADSVRYRGETLWEKRWTRMQEQAANGGSEGDAGDETPAPQ